MLLMVVNVFFPGHKLEVFKLIVISDAVLVVDYHPIWDCPMASFPYKSVFIYCMLLVESYLFILACHFVLFPSVLGLAGGRDFNPAYWFTARC